MRYTAGLSVYGSLTLSFFEVFQICQRDISPGPTNWKHFRCDQSLEEMIKLYVNMTIHFLDQLFTKNRNHMLMTWKTNSDKDTKLTQNFVFYVSKFIKSNSKQKAVFFSILSNKHHRELLVLNLDDRAIPTPTTHTLLCTAQLLFRTILTHIWLDTAEGCDQELCAALSSHFK